MQSYSCSDNKLISSLPGIDTNILVPDKPIVCYSFPQHLWINSVQRPFALNDVSLSEEIKLLWEIINSRQVYFLIKN